MASRKGRFRKLCELEPRLRELYDEAAAVRDDPNELGFCANAVWYGYGEYRGRGLKSRLCLLVGWDAGREYAPNVLAIPDCAEPVIKRLSDLFAEELEEPPRRPGTDPFLCTEEAYDVAYETIYHLLPDCRNCGCA